jgi:hypothetical protein
MGRRILLGLAMAAALAAAGCNDSRSELAKVQAELKKTRAEVDALKAQQAKTYLDDLERLEALRAKGVLTEEEFAAKKQATLQGKGKRADAPLTVTELAQQFRDLQGLYQTSAITNVDRDQKKAQLIAGPIAPGEMKSDLELVQSLYQESTLTNVERDALKKRILEFEAQGK